MANETAPTPRGSAGNLFSIALVFAMLVGAIGWQVSNRFGLYRWANALTHILSRPPCYARGLTLKEIAATGQTAETNGHGYYTGSVEQTVASDELQLTGWAMDLPKKSPISCLTAFSVESGTPLRLTDFQGHLERSDVETSFGADPAYLLSGWKASFSVRGLKSGRHSLSVYGITSDGRFFSVLPGNGTLPEIFIPTDGSK